jgi:hypothetical protein
MQSPNGYVKLPRIASHKNILFWLLLQYYIFISLFFLNNQFKIVVKISDLFPCSEFFLNINWILVDVKVVSDLDKVDGII